MSFIQAWAPYFDSAARTRGRRLHMEEAVSTEPVEPGPGVRAQVADEQTHTVTINGDGATAEAHCTCERFASGRYCEHVWATLLQVQQRGVPRPTDDSAADDAAGLDPADVLKPPGPPKARKRRDQPQTKQRKDPQWMARLALVRPLGSETRTDPRDLVVEHRQVCYVISVELSVRHQGLVVEFRQRQAKRRGWGHLKRYSLTREAAARLPDGDDRELCALILGAAWVDEFGVGARYNDGKGRDAYRISPGARRGMLKRLIETGRCYLDQGQGEEPTLLNWAGDDAWNLWLVGRHDEEDGGLNATVELRRGDDVMPIAEPVLLLGGADGLVCYGEQAAPLDDGEAFGWAGLFRDELRLHGEGKPIHVKSGEVEAFLDRLYRVPQLPPIDLPSAVRREERVVDPRPHLSLTSPPANSPNKNTLTARVWFDYAGQTVGPDVPGAYIVPHGEQAGDASGDDDSAVIKRDTLFERDCVAMLGDLGLRANPVDSDEPLTLRAPLLPQVTGELAASGWVVTADQSALRTAAAPKLSVKSGIDWFELHGSVTFETDEGEQVVDLPAVLAAARQGKTMVELDDGSHGMLPHEWLTQHGLLTSIGELEDDHVRFTNSQAALLDALLAEQELVDVDDRFAQMRQQLRTFDKVEPLRETASFAGELRAYQRDGLGWLGFLRTFGLGGVLADDMGLGKTVQVLAMLVARYKDQANGDGESPDTDRTGPTLVVAPRSVVFNWLDEAGRFANDLRVADYSGSDRHGLRDKFSEYDVIVTSYGLMRRDAAELTQHTFDYVVLDEAQAIKNPSSQAAKAARLLQCRHRVALTGTPVENHLGDLWSIFEFLNPGMLGSATRFSRWVRGAERKPRGRQAVTPKSEAERAAEQAAQAGKSQALGKRSAATNLKVAEQAGKALRPFILRRTKNQVLTELPDKTEQTIVCHMEKDQRKTYDALLKHYRALLLKKGTPGSGGGAAPGGGQQTMLVIEALLRLRQAACHPALIDPQREDAASAKLDVLLEQLTELVEEGHKALVFSQFTSMLSLVKPRLDKAGIKYEYLDGQTRDRRSRVERFQGDDECPVFLISLKAGGLGLNLTAASYVFILDPWWNPAVEQQAIDRAHRIGQTNHVFAYRLICHDTVEQRIAELQDRKRELADAIVGGQDNLLQSLTREDLELLLK